METPLLPKHICRNEEERHIWRGEVLAFIRDHVEAAETYRLALTDLESGELLPTAPEWVTQNEYEERTRIGFALERLTKAVQGGRGTPELVANCDTRAGMAADQREEADEFRTTRLDIHNGPEVIVIERK